MQFRQVAMPRFTLAAGPTWHVTLATLSSREAPRVSSCGKTETPSCAAISIPHELVSRSRLAPVLDGGSLSAKRYCDAEAQRVMAAVRALAESVSRPATGSIMTPATAPLEMLGNGCSIRQGSSTIRSVAIYSCNTIPASQAVESAWPTD